MRLILMRHAEAAHEGRDHGRPLTPHGRACAERMAQALLTAGYRPDQVRLSDARRTRETWAQLAPHFPETRADEYATLYLATTDDLFTEALTRPPECLMILAHNPGLSQLAMTLGHHPVHLAPADAALLEERDGAWRLVAHLTPFD